MYIYLILPDQNQKANPGKLMFRGTANVTQDKGALIPLPQRQ